MSTEYWYNLRTGTVEKGPQSSWQQLLGPYKSYAEAAAALDRVRQNNERWDDQDKDDDAGFLGFMPRDDDEDTSP
ncbi:hypothetical protein [Nesterenkonia alba]|uniref:hypothetical protein n=1 Tax=Nesterenkonia alba TaxID=515814 RepID=UPI0003B6C21F|nr:hypothetical protein [Nesterenkonia alba]